MSRSGIVLLVVLFAGCGQKPVSYREQIQPILNKNCVNCHSGEKPSGKIDLSSYEKLMKSRTVSGKEQLAIPGSPTESRLFILCATTQPHFRMPPDTTTLPPLPVSDLALVRDWIKQGAKDN